MTSGPEAHAWEITEGDKIGRVSHGLIGQKARTSANEVRSAMA